MTDPRNPPVVQAFVHRVGERLWQGEVVFRRVVPGTTDPRTVSTFPERTVRTDMFGTPQEAEAACRAVVKLEADKKLWARETYEVVL